MESASEEVEGAESDAESVESEHAEASQQPPPSYLIDFVRSCCNCFSSASLLCLQDKHPIFQ